MLCVQQPVATNDPFSSHPYRQGYLSSNFNYAFPLSPTDLSLSSPRSFISRPPSPSTSMPKSSEADKPRSRSRTRVYHPEFSVLSPSRPPPPVPSKARSGHGEVSQQPAHTPLTPTPSSSRSPSPSPSPPRTTPRPRPPPRTRTSSSSSLYKQVLVACFTQSPAGQKSRLMGHRMAVRLWDANRELERLVKMHSEALECFEEERASRADWSSTTPQEPSRMEESSSFLTFADDWDCIDPALLPRSRLRSTE